MVKRISVIRSMYSGKNLSLDVIGLELFYIAPIRRNEDFLTESYGKKMNNWRDGRYTILQDRILNADQILKLNRW